MRVKVKRFDKSLPLPAYATSGAVGLDCAARESTTIAANSIGYIPLNVAVKPPKNHCVLIFARSSLHKRGLILANGVGLGDEDYCGNDDEYKAAVFNFTGQPVNIAKGDRIAQMIFKPYEKVEWEEVEAMDDKTRGGFGTTGI